MIDPAEDHDAQERSEQAAVKDHAGGGVEDGGEEALDIIDGRAVVLRKMREPNQEKQQVGTDEHEEQSKQAADEHADPVMGSSGPDKEDDQ